MTITRSPDLDEVKSGRCTGPGCRGCSSSSRRSALRAGRRSRLRLIGFLRSGGLAPTVLLVAEKLDQSFDTVAELRSFTSIPAMASIRRIVTGSDRGRRCGRAGSGMAVTVTSLGLLIELGNTVGHRHLPPVRLLLPSLEAQ